jgi:hypothetical protein
VQQELPLHASNQTNDEYPGAGHVVLAAKRNTNSKVVEMMVKLMKAKA